MNLRIFSAVSLIMVLFSGFVLAQNGELSNEAKKAFNDANQAFKQGKTSEALDKYKEAVTLEPGFALAHYWMGNVYKKQKDFVNATKAYQTAIEKDKKMVSAYAALGYVQELQRKFNDAINTYQAAISIDPDEKRAHYGLGEVNRKQENYKQAVPFYQKALEIDPSYDDALKGLGICNMELGDFESAAAALDAAAQITRSRSEKASTYLRLGDAYRQLKRYDEAEVAYNSCLENARQSLIKGGANFGLGEIYKARDKAKALQYFREAAKDRTWKQSAEYEIDLLTNPDKYSG